MHGINPRTVPLRALKPRFIILHSTHERSGEEDLRELSPRVEGVGADIGVYFVDGGECEVGERGAVEVGREEDEAGVGGALESGEEGKGEEELREVVYLEVGVEVVDCKVEFSDAFAGIEDKLNCC